MISLIVVNYRAAALAVDCIASARRASRAELEVIVVDNSVDLEEAERLRPHADAIAAPPNDGYAAAINIGRKLASGDVFVVSNPDVIFGTGSIDLLASALEGRVAVAGPALFWDDADRWLRTPAERTTTTAQLDAVIASRSCTVGVSMRGTTGITNIARQYPAPRPPAPVGGRRAARGGAVPRPIARRGFDQRPPRGACRAPIARRKGPCIMHLLRG